MHVKTVVVGILAVALLAGGAYAQSGGGKLLPPPALNLPAGADIMTDVALSDNDLLKVIKQLIPVIGDVAKIGFQQGFGAAKTAAGVGVPPGLAEAIEKLDTTKLSEAIDQVKSVRVVVAKFPLKPTKKELLASFDKGAAKMGKFSRMMSDIGMGPGVVAVYAEADSGGYVAYMHDPAKKVIYAGRLMGFLDLPKIIEWGVQAGKTFAAPAPAVEEKKESAPAPEVAPATEPAPAEATPAAEEAPKTE